MRNRYSKHAHVSERKFKQILTCFCRDFTAEYTSLITGISRNTINGLFGKFRARILKQTSSNMDLDGENEFARGKNHVNGIESFWSYAKRIRAPLEYEDKPC